MKQYSFVLNEGFLDYLNRIPSYLQVWNNARADTEKAKENPKSLISKFHTGNKIFGALDTARRFIFPKQKGFMNRAKNSFGGVVGYGARSAGFDTGYTLAKFVKRLKKHGIPTT